MKNKGYIMNKELKELIDSILKERKNHNPTPLRVVQCLDYLIEQKDITDVFDLKNLLEKNQSYLLRTPNFGRKCLDYLKEKFYSTFTFKTKTIVTYVRVPKEIEIVESRDQ